MCLRKTGPGEQPGKSVGKLVGGRGKKSWKERPEDRGWKWTSEFKMTSNSGNNDSKLQAKCGWLKGKLQLDCRTLP